ncbi:hypothetical protein Hanom_Chr09g00793261 [Helianthus anomalus]
MITFSLNLGSFSNCFLLLPEFLNLSSTVIFFGTTTPEINHTKRSFPQLIPNQKIRSFQISSPRQIVEHLLCRTQNISINGTNQNPRSSSEVHPNQPNKNKHTPLLKLWAIISHLLELIIPCFENRKLVQMECVSANRRRFG